MIRKDLGGEWAVYLAPTREERRQLHKMLSATPFKFTRGDCLSEPCKKWIFKGAKPLFAFLGGSGLTGAIDDDSDYDVVAVTVETKDFTDPNFVIFRGRHIHSYIHTMDSMADAVLEDTMLSVGLIKHANIKKEDIIYSTVDDRVLNSFIEHKSDLFQIGALMFDRARRAYIEELIKTGKINLSGPVKHLATALEVKFLLKGEPIKDNLDYLIRVKRMRWRGIGDEDLRRLIEDLKEYCSLMDEYRKNHTVEAAKANWKSSYAYKAIKRDEKE